MAAAAAAVAILTNVPKHQTVHFVQNYVVTVDWDVVQTGMYPPSIVP